jgi:branched-chain amino acid transport system substrate-binding protein
VDVTTNILNMKQKNVEFCIFQGYIADPIQNVIKQSKDYGLKCQFMGTFWSTEKQLLDLLGPLADEYIGVTAYSYYYQDQYPMIKKIREWNQKHNPKHAEYRTQALCRSSWAPPVIRPSSGRQGRPGDRRQPGQGPTVD